MRTLKTIIAVFGLVAMFYACTPADEDVQPDKSKTELKKFDVKSTTGGDENDDGLPDNP